MDDSEREDSCTLTWNPRGITLNDLSIFTSLLAQLHSDIAVPYVTEEFYQPGSNVVLPGPPSVTTIRMSSPLLIELVSGPSGIGAVSLGMVAYILRHPDKLGGFIAEVRKTWHDGNREAEAAKLRRVEARLRYVEARARVQTRGRALQRFDRELTRTRDRTRRPYPRRNDRNTR
jgi:hypothetical protein